MIMVFGARGTISDIDVFLSRLLIFSKNEDLVMQAFDAEVVFGSDHLISATEHAQRAFQQGTNATNSLQLEILLYAAGERQIHRAIKKIGVKSGKQMIAFVLIDEKKRTLNKTRYDAVIIRLLCSFHLTRDDKVLEGNRDTLRRFGINDLEIRTVPKSKFGDLILEKVAMVDVVKKC
jgi:KEOPS complex subunit Cgi121